MVITNVFHNILDESNRKLNNIWLDKACEFYNRSVKLSFQDNDIEMYSTHNQGKFITAEKFIRTLKNKTYKHMTSVSKNMYINELDDIVNNYHNTCHSAIKMTPFDVNSSTYVNFN